jgi:hypothetical protein
MANRTQSRDDEQSPVTTDHGAAGRIEVDRNGNRVWRWARDVLDSTSILLKRLENKDLALEPTQKVPVMQRGGSAAPKQAAAPKKRVALSMAPEPGGRDGAGGFDPYNSR